MRTISARAKVERFWGGGLHEPIANRIAGLHLATFRRKNRYFPAQNSKELTTLWNVFVTIAGCDAMLKLCK
jgi:hypothetical protein